MNARRIYGGLNVDFNRTNYVNFAILDRACDECLGRENGCTGCEEVEKPWNEYFQILEYDKFGHEKVTYEKDPHKALKKLVRILQHHMDIKEENACIDMES